LPGSRNSVSFEHGYVLIHQAVDEAGVVKPTKTKDVRKVPIEPNLLPLLEKMHEEAGKEGKVIGAMPPRESLASRLRKYIEWAGVTRADLFANDETRRRIDFHDLRHTGITLRAVRGDEPLKVQRAACHDDLRTTQRYINEAQTFEGASFGEPFPDVPLGRFSIFGSNYVTPAGENSRSSVFSEVPWRPYADEFRTALVELAAA
jgi:hypothetical protein